MRSVVPRFLLTIAFGLAAHAHSDAATLRVGPVLVDVTAPGATSTLKLQNEGTRPIEAQIRVFRWLQVNGTETLEPTDDVVASPPAVTLAANAEYVMRIVRVTKRPVSGEESYRLLVDQLPEPNQQKTSMIHFLVRQSIPVFFGTPQRSEAAATWSIVADGKTASIVVNNTGETRERISALRIHMPNGETISLGNGLVGYALGRSTMKWALRTSARQFTGIGSVSISGQSANGPIVAVAQVRSGH